MAKKKAEKKDARPAAESKKPAKAGDLGKIIESLKHLYDDLKAGEWRHAIFDLGVVWTELESAIFEPAPAKAKPLTLDEATGHLQAHIESLEEEGCLCEETLGDGPAMSDGPTKGVDWLSLMPLLIAIFKALAERLKKESGEE